MRNILFILPVLLVLAGCGEKVVTKVEEKEPIREVVPVVPEVKEEIEEVVAPENTSSKSALVFSGDKFTFSYLDNMTTSLEDIEVGFGDSPRIHKYVLVSDSATGMRISIGVKSTNQTHLIRPVRSGVPAGSFVVDPSFNSKIEKLSKYNLVDGGLIRESWYCTEQTPFSDCLPVEINGLNIVAETDYSDVTKDLLYEAERRSDAVVSSISI